MGNLRSKKMMRLLVLSLAVAAAIADTNHDALMDFHKSTGGASWKSNDGWGKTDDYCSWFGVSCTHELPTPTVYQLDLSNNNLAGPIPESITKIEGLKTLNLDNNKITGNIPQTFHVLPKLENIRLQHNQLTGAVPPQMFNLTVQYPTIQEIDLSYNQLTGTISEDLFGPEKIGPFFPTDGLKVLNLRYNQVSGPIPERMTRAAVMVSALFGGNKMTGKISDDMGAFLVKRKYCDLTGNSWSCPLPAGVADKCQAVCK